MLRCSRCAASTSSSRAPRRSCPRPRAPVRCPPPASVGGAVGSRGRWRCSSLRCPVFRRHRRGAGGDLRHPPAAPGPHRPPRRAGPAPPRPSLRARQHGAAVGGGREAQHGHHRQPPVRSPPSLAGGLTVAFRGRAVGLRLGCARQVRVDPTRSLRRERCVWRRRAPGRRARIAQSPRWAKQRRESCINGSCVIIITRPTFRLSSVQPLQTAPLQQPVRCRQHTALSCDQLAEHLLCLHDLPHLPRIATILHTQPAANNPSATRCEAAKGPGGGRREEVTCARRREARAAVSDSAEISTCVTKHNSKHVNPSIRQRVIF